MWDDLPKRMPSGAKTLIIIIVILVIAALGYSAWILFKPQKSYVQEFIQEIYKIKFI